MCVEFGPRKNKKKSPDYLPSLQFFFFLCPGMASRGHGGGFDHRLASPRLPAHATAPLLHFFPPALTAVRVLHQILDFSDTQSIGNTGDFFGVNRCGATSYALC